VRTNKLTTLALALATVTAVTMFLKIPLPASKGYFNLGEAVIYTLAFLFGGPTAALAGGLGAALADLLAGYTFYAPITLVIKGLEGWLVGRLAARGKIKAVGVGALVLMLGYGAAAFFLTRNMVAVLWELGIDFLQATFGALVAIPLSKALEPVIGGEQK
jgi:uncharacterized membrane protein